MGVKPYRIWFDNLDGFTKIYDGIRYFVLFASEKYNAIYDKINYLVSEKSGITRISQELELIHIILYL